MSKTGSAVTDDLWNDRCQFVRDTMVSDICKQRVEAVDWWHRYMRPSASSVFGGDKGETWRTPDANSSASARDHRETPESSREVEKDEIKSKTQPHCVHHLSKETQETPQSTCKQEKVSCDSIVFKLTSNARQWTSEICRLANEIPIFSSTLKKVGVQTVCTQEPLVNFKNNYKEMAINTLD